jgi:hypothetical protein
MIRRETRRKKLRNIRFLPIFCIMMLLLGSAYAELSQNISLEGTVTIEPQSNIDKDDGYDSYALDAEIISYNSWGSSGEYSAVIAFSITNNYDFDTENWFVVVTIPNTNILSLVTWETDGLGIKNYGIDNDSITIGSTSTTDYSWRATVRAGETKNQNFQITIDDASNLDKMQIYAYTRVEKDDEEIVESTIDSNNYTYSEKKENTISENTITNTINNSNDTVVDDSNNTNIVENSNTTISNTTVDSEIEKDDEIIKNNDYIEENENTTT